MEDRQKAKPITKKKLLMVEGKDEENFFKALLEHIEMKDMVDIFDVKGKDNFRNSLPGLKNTSGFSNLDAFVVIRDADDSFENAFKSVKGVLEENKFEPPIKAGEFSKGTPKVGIFIMPDNKRKGMLETLCMETVKNEEGMACVNPFIDCAKKLKEPPKTIDKAKALAFLAIKPDAENRVGIGAQKHYWNFDADELKPLIDFLHRLK
jgi:hypothetical protein